MSELNRRRPRIRPWVVVTLLLVACAGPWKTAPDHLVGPRWVITPPEGWMHLSTQESEMFSKDGPYLEYILIQTNPLDRGFRYTRQKMNRDMLPHEAAQLISDNMRSDPHIRQFRLLSSSPTTMDGHPGFRLTYTYLDADGVEIKTIYCGVVLPNQFFSLRYTAARRHYFDKELPAFNRAFDSLRLH